MFDGFDLVRRDAGSTGFRVRIGGIGPAVLLLHGHPQTHVMWHAVAPRMARSHTLVIPDLPGYGESRPWGPGRVPRGSRSSATRHTAGGARHHPNGRDMASDGFGARNGVLALAVPRAAGADAGASHRGDRDAFYFRSGRDRFAPDALADYFAAVAHPEVIHAMREDYRAGATIDRHLDDADLDAGRRIEAPTLVLWSAEGELARWDPVAIWRRWADDVGGRPIAAGHFLAEESPDEVAAELERFLGDAVGGSIGR